MELNGAELGWDYNCPQYVDFTEPLPIDDDADKWFEHDHEDFEEDCSINKDSRIKEEKKLTPKATSSKTATPKTATPKARVAPMRSGVKIQDEERKTPKAETPKAIINPYKPEGSSGPLTRHQAKMLPAEESAGSNLFSSLKEWRSKSTKSNSEKKVVAVAPLTSGNGLKRQHSSSSNVRAESKSSSLRRSNSVTHADRVARTHTRGHSVGRGGSLDGRKEGEAPAAKKPKTVCKPTTPTFMKRKKMTTGSPKKKTSEEQELEQIANMRKELERRRKMATNSFKKVKTSNSYAPVHSSQVPTQTHDFNFSTDNRIKGKPSTTSNETMADFARSLRSGDISSQPPKGNTCPQPFNFTANHKTAAPREKYQSMAQSIAAFHRATPDRFRRRPRGTSSGEKLLKARSPRHQTLTQPHTPHLATRSRSRPVHVPSQKDIEDQEYEEIKKHQFKANPVNVKIMSKPTGLHKPEPKPPTKPEEFHLHLEHRIKERQINKEDDDETDQFVFRAQPLPRKILEGTVGVHKKEKIPCTTPQSPAFALKNRVRIPVEIPEEKETVSRSLRSGVAYDGLPFQPTLEHKSTTPEPFSFLGRYRDPIEVREELRKQTLEEEQRAREFRANPLPNLEPTLPEKNSRDPTRPEPFNLRLDVRGEKKSEEWNHRVEEEIAKQKAAAKFKARPAVVLQQEPFIPAKNSRLLTDVSCVVLNTEKRAVDRDDYEMRKKAREAQLAEMNHERELQKQEEEKAAIAKLRSEMVHKPGPVRKFKPLGGKTDRNCTIPQSPQFSDRLRRKVPSS